MNLQQPKLSMNKILPLLLLAVVVIAVAFTACSNKNNGGNNNADDAQGFSEYTTENPNGISDTSSPVYGFEEEDDDEVGLTSKDSNNVPVSTTSKNEPNSSVPEYSSISEEGKENQPSLPPKSDSQSGEWGASVNN